MPPSPSANDAFAYTYFITQVQTIVSRSVDPIEGGVVTFGSMRAGTTNNVIVDTAKLHGTIRAWTQDRALHIQQKAERNSPGCGRIPGMK